LPEGGPSDPLAIIELPVRSSELAAAIGVAPETFSRAVTKLVSSGILHRLGPRRFQVLDAEALSRAVGGPEPVP
jgi:DNA-binding IclR family transcriptional regulator